MKIGVMGSGGVGGYFGARLAQAGNQVSFIARGAHLEAMAAHGLTVLSPRGDIHVHPCVCSSDPVDVGPVDVVLFATKLYDTEPAGELCAPFVGPDTAVISLLNGVDSEEVLGRILGPEHIVGGVARISAEIESPGVVRHRSDFASIEVGEMDGHESSRLERFCDVAREAGIDVELRNDIRVAIWEKFILMASLSAITALTRLPLGPIRANPASLELLRNAAREVGAVARAKQVPIPDDAVDKVIGMLAKLPESMKASTLMDLESGRRLELEWLSGAVCRLGRESGVDTPVHCLVSAALGPFADGKPDA